MTGYDEAKAWLRANAPDWRITHAEQSLQPGFTVGQPTGLRYEVELGQVHTVDGYDYQVWLKGEGGTMVEAVQNAVGGLTA